MKDPYDSLNFHQCIAHIWVPSIESVNMTQSISVQEETDILTTAPEKFQLMLKELGIERTLKTLVMLLLR